MICHYARQHRTGGWCEGEGEGREEGGGRNRQTDRSNTVNSHVPALGEEAEPGESPLNSDSTDTAVSNRTDLLLLVFNQLLKLSRPGTENVWRKD